MINIGKYILHSRSSKRNCRNLFLIELTGLAPLTPCGLETPYSITEMVNIGSDNSFPISQYKDYSPDMDFR